jgi:hypothetical protein
MALKTRWNGDRARANLRTPWLHVANPAISAPHADVDYGIRRDIAPVHARHDLWDLQKDMWGDENFQKSIRANLARVLEEQDREYVRRSHSSQVRYAMNLQLRGLADQAWGTMTDGFINTQVGRVRSGAQVIQRDLVAELEREGLWKYIAPTGGAAFAAYMLCTGQNVNFNLPGGFNFGTRLGMSPRMEPRAGSFSLGTPWFTASVNYQLDAPDVRDPSLPAPSDPVQAAEKVQIAVGHTIPYLGLNTSLSIATTTGTISAAISRNLLIPNLSGSFSTTRSVRPTSGGSFGEEVVNLSYGTNF